MKLVTAALNEKGLTVEQLPQELVDRIDNLRDSIKKYNQAVDAYDDEPEQDKETEKKLDEMEDIIAQNEADLAEDIRNFKTSAQEQTPAAPEKEEKSSGIGWLIFGGIALVATLGAVNLFKKR